ncbi:MAG: S-layer homology domain-containing protein, partial [Bacillota bacterium]|nr:S-layer homology domain-containing protein [Bacillota bacterium]
NNVYNVISDINKGEFEANVSVGISQGAKAWVAVMVVDENGNFAITNPYWVEQVDRIYQDTAHWGLDAINYLSDLGAITGYPDGTFKPDNNITRAEFAAIIARMSDFTPDEKLSDVKFSDVKEGSWYYDYVMELAKAGILNGYTDGTFKPNDMIARSEIAKILAVIDGWDENYKPGEKLAFSDIGGKWYTTYVQYLADNNLAKGYGDGTFRPDNNATRAESAQFIYNAVK